MKKKAALLVSASLIISGIAAAIIGANSANSAAEPTLEVLSSKPEYVTGGDALVRITLNQTEKAQISASLNSQDVTSAFAADKARPGTLVGLIRGLHEGANTLLVRVGGSEASLKLVDYPQAGPVVSGVHVEPYVCMTNKAMMPDGSMLGPSKDKNCSASPKIQYVYKNKAGIFLPLPNRTKLPDDVAVTTTSAGITVPYVIRFEAGTIDRGIYNIAILQDPTKEGEPTPLQPPKGWNRRISYVHGYGCVGGWYYQGNATGASTSLYDIDSYLSEGVLKIVPRPKDLAASFNVLSDAWLARGYAVIANTLSHPSISCNPHLAGEATMMTKEHFIKEYGTPEFTVSTGGSGGAYTSLQIADAFPGVFDGVNIKATFPDALSIGLTGLHANLLFHYWSDVSPHSLSESQKIAISGYLSVHAALDAANQAARTDPSSGRKVSWSSAYTAGQWEALGGAYPDTEAVPKALRWDPVENPKGARADVFDVGRNIYGVDSMTGYALRPFDNEGVQYGLNALNSGAITPAQFIDLNAKIGGVDVNGNFTATRSKGDPEAIRRVYLSGVNLGGNGGLASIPIFDDGESTESGRYHYGWYHFALRDRLREANGNSDNMVMWRGPNPAEKEMNAFERWVAAYKADTSSDTQRVKVIRAKPSEAVEGCWDKSTPAKFIKEYLVFSDKPVSACTALWPVYSNTLKEAGGPLAANILKCTLKPIDSKDYRVPMTHEDLERLAAIFPTGVCDWSKPGVNQHGVLPYASFGPSPVNKVFDITAQAR